MIHNFSDEQYDAFVKILDFCNSPGGGMYLLTGVAGTGKTYLTTKIVTEIKSNKIIVSAPTHKAVKILRDEGGVSYQNVTFSTVHSALGLRENIDGFGVVTFVEDKTVQKKIENANFLIIDEASMLHDELFDIVASYVKIKRLKVIFVGDPVQIPPIGKLNAKPFMREIQFVHKIKVSELTTIIRQNIGHPIILSSSIVRDRLNQRNSFADRNNQVTPVGSVYFCKRSDFSTIAADYFGTLKFDNDIDYARVIAWTNAAVDAYNKIIRQILYKNDLLPNIMMHERLIIDAPIIKKDRAILNTNDEIKVIGIKVAYEDVKGVDARIKYYDTTVRYSTAFFGDMTQNIKILHEDSTSEFENLLNLVKEVALKERQGSDQAKMYWIMYYQLRNHFAQVKYSYAITAHKSQGSTYKNTIIDEFDINKNPDTVEKNRILYTAITRAKNNVYILQ